MNTTTLILILVVIVIAAVALYHYIYKPLSAKAEALTASVIKKSMLDAIGLGDD
jgi:peptidoglycan/LPS O-acetylase OafA/YrhL